MAHPGRVRAQGVSAGKPGDAERRLGAPCLGAGGERLEPSGAGPGWARAEDPARVGPSRGGRGPGCRHGRDTGADCGVAGFLLSTTGRRGRQLRGRDARGESRGPGRLSRGWGPALHRQVRSQLQGVDAAFCCQKFPGRLKKESLRQWRLRSRWKRLFLFSFICLISLFYTPARDHLK